MPNTSNRLGRGLEALIPKSPLASGRTIFNIPISEISPNPYQPRSVFSEESIQSLADSISKHGIAHPLLVRRKGDAYELIAGERRLRACQVANLDTVPVIVKDISDQDSLELALIENVLREDLNVLDVANSYSRLINEFNLSHDEIGEVFGKKRSTITNTLRILNLPKDIQELIKNGTLSEGHGRALVSIDNPELLYKCLNKILKDALSVRATEKFVAKLKSPKKKSRKRNVLNVEEYLDSILRISEKYSTAVQIQGSEKKGTVTLEYSSKSDLDRLLSSL